MNLVINTLSALWGGGQVYLYNLLKYAEEFPDVKIYILAPPEFVDNYNFQSVDIIPCVAAAKSIIHRHLFERWKLPRLLKHLKADILFCPGGIINTVPPPGCLTATTFQNMLIFDTSERKRYPFGYMRLRLSLLERFSRTSFEQADIVIFISEYGKQVVDAKVPNRKGISVVIPHGLPEEFRTGNRNDIPRLNWLPAEGYLLYVSNLDVFKAQIQLVQEYSILCRKRNTREKLLLIGPEYPPYARRVRKEIKRLNLQDKVIITGKVPYANLPAIYHYANANIFASSCENCPNIVLESLGSGRPLFLSNRPPMPELAGDAAVYFDPYKPNELANLLLRYLDDEEWIKEMGKKAFERSFLHNWEKTARKTFKAFKDLV